MIHRIICYGFSVLGRLHLRSVRMLDRAVKGSFNMFCSSWNNLTKWLSAGVYGLWGIVYSNNYDSVTICHSNPIFYYSVEQQRTCSEECLICFSIQWTLTGTRAVWLQNRQKRTIKIIIEIVHVTAALYFKQCCYH